MRTRFRKVWCPECSSMQFAGECGHARVVEAPLTLQLQANCAEKMPFARRATAFARAAFAEMPDELLRKMGLQRIR
jgi:hypothetical protein